MNEGIKGRGNGMATSAGGGAAAGSALVTTAVETDVYFTADIESDGPIPGEFSMLSFSFVYAGRFNGTAFEAPADYSTSFEVFLKPISERFEVEALRVNGLDRTQLLRDGKDPAEAMTAAATWLKANTVNGTAVLVAYPLSFDWAWLYWYFIKFTGHSPFNHSRCLDFKTAVAVRGGRPVVGSGHARLPSALRSTRAHTHRAIDDATELADMLAKFFAWDGK